MSFLHSAGPDLAAQFPGWEIERRPDGMLHAWLAGTDPPLVVSGKDPACLRDQIMSIALRPHGPGRRRPQPGRARGRSVLRSWRVRIAGSPAADAVSSAAERGAGQDQITAGPAKRRAVVKNLVRRAGATGPAMPRGERFQRLQALEDAIAWRRSRASAPCIECTAGPAGQCTDHARDQDLISEYQQAARRLGAGETP